jgi:hypothetical protein
VTAERTQAKIARRYSTASVAAYAVVIANLAVVPCGRLETQSRGRSGAVGSSQTSSIFGSLRILEAQDTETEAGASGAALPPRRSVESTAARARALCLPGEPSLPARSQDLLQLAPKHGPPAFAA